MDHYNHITREFDGVECRLAATTNQTGFRDDIVNGLRGEVYEHVHVCINPVPTGMMNKYMIFVGGKEHEAIETHKVLGAEVHTRTRQHL